MTEQQARQVAVQHWLNKAADSLESAHSELRSGRFDFAVNRSHYAALYAASAVLLTEGRHFVKHAGVRAAIHRTLVKPGLLDVRLGRVFDRIFDARQRADYLALSDVPADEAASLGSDAETFVLAMRAFVEPDPPDPDAV